MSKLETNTIDTISGTSNLTIGSSNASTITLKSGATLTNFPDNTPAFFAYQTSNQTIANNTNTVVSLDAEAFDTDNAFASNTFTVPNGKAGKYFFTIGVRKNNFTSSRFNIYLEDGDGASIVSAESGTDSAYGIANVSIVKDLSAGTTIVMKVYHNQGGNQTTLQGIHQVYFGGYRIIE